MRVRTPSIRATAPTPMAALARRTCPPDRRVPARSAPPRRAPGIRRGRRGRGRVTRPPSPAHGCARKTPCPAPAAPGSARRAAALDHKAPPASALPERKTVSAGAEDGLPPAAARLPRAARAQAGLTGPGQKGRNPLARRQDSALAAPAGQAPDTGKARRTRDRPTDPADHGPVPAGINMPQGSQARDSKARDSADLDSRARDRRPRGRSGRNDSDRGSAAKVSTGRRRVPTPRAVSPTRAEIPMPLARTHMDRERLNTAQANRTDRNRRDNRAQGTVRPRLDGQDLGRGGWVPGQPVPGIPVPGLTSTVPLGSTFPDSTPRDRTARENMAQDSTAHGSQGPGSTAPGSGVLVPDRERPGRAPDSGRPRGNSGLAAEPVGSATRPPAAIVPVSVIPADGRGPAAPSSGNETVRCRSRRRTPRGPSRRSRTTTSPRSRATCGYCGPRQGWTTPTWRRSRTTRCERWLQRRAG
jgi:hypothetical protein